MAKKEKTWESMVEGAMKAVEARPRASQSGCARVTWTTYRPAAASPACVNSCAVAGIARSSSACPATPHLPLPSTRTPSAPVPRPSPAYPLTSHFHRPVLVALQSQRQQGALSGIWEPVMVAQVGLTPTSLNT